MLKVIDRIYESSLDPSGWVSALDELSAFVGAIAADLYITPASQSPFVAFTGISDDLMHDYLTYFHDQNERVKAIQRSAEGKLILDYDVATPAEIGRSPYYQDLLFKNGYGLFIGCSALNRGEESALFGIHYARDAEAYHDEHFKRLKLVIPHIRRAAQLQTRLNASIARESQLTDVIDRMSSGIVLLDHNAEVVHLNQAAERLVARPNSVSIKNRKVTLTQPHLERELERMVLETIRRAPPAGGAGGAIRIESESPGLPVSIIVFPLPRRVSHEDSLGAILVISEPFARVPSAALEILRALVGLTPAEAKTAIALANGESVDSYAKRTGRSTATVRDQLKSAMSKAGVKRQTALVCLILGMVASLADVER